MNNNFDRIKDEELARLAAGGDRAAFDEIIRRYCRPLVQFVASRTAVFQDAEDVVQETFLRFYQNILLFDDRYSLKNWLYTIAYRVAVSTYRKKRPMLLSQEAIQQRADVPVEAEPADTGLWAIVKEMKPDDCTILWLRYKQDMKIEEIAQVMNKTKTGVRVHLHRARNRLAKIINTDKIPVVASNDNQRREVLVERAE